MFWFTTLAGRGRGWGAIGEDLGDRALPGRGGAVIGPVIRVRSAWALTWR